MSESNVEVDIPRQETSAIPDAEDETPYAGELGHALHPTAMATFGPVYAEFFNAQSTTDAGVTIAAMKWCRNQDERIFTQQNINFLGCINKGTYGNVYKAVVKSSGEQVAIKQVRVLSDSKSGETSCRTDQIWKERDILLTLQHPRVVKMLGAFYEGGTHFVFEMCYGDIQGKFVRLSEKTKIRFSCQLLQGLEWMHSKNILHNDIRPENLLINTDHNLVISDFGSAVLLPEGKDFMKIEYCKSVAAYSDKLARSKYIFGKPTDVFAAACVIYEITTGYQLHSQPHSTSISPQASISKKHDDELIQRDLKPSNLDSLLRKMLLDDVYARPSAADCLKDSELSRWLEEMDLTWETLDNDAEVGSIQFVIRTEDSFDYQQIETSAHALKYSLHLIYHEDLSVQRNLASLPIMPPVPEVEMDTGRVNDLNISKQFLDSQAEWLATTRASDKSGTQSVTVQSPNQDPTFPGPKPSIPLGVSAQKRRMSAEDEERQKVEQVPKSKKRMSKSDLKEAKAGGPTHDITSQRKESSGNNHTTAQDPSPSTSKSSTVASQVASIIETTTKLMKASKKTTAAIPAPIGSREYTTRIQVPVPPPLSVEERQRRKAAGIIWCKMCNAEFRDLDLLTRHIKNECPHLHLVRLIP